MHEDSPNRVRRIWENLLPWISLVCLCAIILEGIFYYWNIDNWIFKFLEIFQNCVNAFLFKPSVKLSDALEFMHGHTFWFVQLIGYLYGLAVFIAPICTLTALYRITEFLFSRSFRKTQKKTGKHSAVFGWNDLTKSIVSNHVKSGNPEESAIAVYTSESMSGQFRADMAKFPKQKDIKK